VTHLDAASRSLEDIAAIKDEGGLLLDAADLYDGSVENPI
jgi:hypothetical protein